MVIIMVFLEEKEDLQLGMQVILMDQREKTVDHQEKTDQRERTVDHLEKKVNDDFVQINHLVVIDTNLHEDDFINEVDHLVHQNQDRKSIFIKERSDLLFFLTKQ
ncbi:MAG: hypothetical protein WCG25_03060 [bacterium]